ncbi:MAG: hypothetical protein P4L35_01705 [Ignavibacteriaceae bacterium]|nr:hypothetical protein [Ignavibacteriaceae bacterium]
MNLILVVIIIYVLNIPFGYWRQNVRKFSLQWALSIHLPIPVIIIIRIYSGIGFKFITYPVLVAAFALGQLTGSLIYKSRVKRQQLAVSGCIIMDLYRGRNQD